jgi:hypothetical protein
VVSIISDYFNIYFPILLIILTLATYFSLGTNTYRVPIGNRYPPKS